MGFQYNFEYYTTIPQPWNSKVITLHNKDEQQISFLNRSFIFKRKEIPKHITLNK